MHWIRLTVTVFPFANCSGRCNILALPRRIHPALRSDAERSLAQSPYYRPYRFKTIRQLSSCEPLRFVRAIAAGNGACGHGRARLCRASIIINSPLLLGTNNHIGMYNPPTLRLHFPPESGLTQTNGAVGQKLQLVVLGCVCV